jgi:hypothetical protein
MKHTLRQSLNDLEPAQRNQGTSASPTDLVARCAALRSKVLQEYTVEDLRLLIGQGIGLTWLVPLALAQLAQNLFAEGDYYPGDLLSVVVRVPDSYWQKHPASLKDFVQLLHTQLSASPLAGMPVSDFREVQHRMNSLATRLV